MELVRLFSHVAQKSFSFVPHQSKRPRGSFLPFCHLGRAQSLREICGGLAASEGKLRHAAPVSASILALGGCRSPQSEKSAAQTPYRRRVTEQTGPTHDLRLVAQVSEVQVAPRHAYRTWVYNGKFPGAEIRVKEGDRLRIVVDNELPEGTTVHWHGVRVPNPMDGVPGLTQQPIKPGENFVYDYVAAPTGTYIYHAHAGLQLDRGLMGPLIIEEKQPHISYDREYVIVLDDFLPDAPKPLAGGGGMMGSAGSGMMGRMMGGTSQGQHGMMGGGMMGGEMPPYAGLMINAHLPEDPVVFDARKGERLRIRFLNPSGASAYRVAVGGHRMAITHTDGRPVKPVPVDAFDIGMGERYDVLVEPNNPGVWWIVAAPLQQNLPPARASCATLILRKPGQRCSPCPRGYRRDICSTFPNSSRWSRC